MLRPLALLSLTAATLVIADDPPKANLVNKLADFFLDLPQFDYPVQGVCSLVAKRQQTMADEKKVQTTRTDSCGAITVIFARGSCEPGNVGISAGPPFFEALQNALGNRGRVAVNGLTYSADFKDFLTVEKDSGKQLSVSLCPFSLSLSLTHVSR
ncbi:hypothetical protein XA68_13485 [Ophiocordyceps unilateralis]|uniref:cutinase n=1 Tax=Ophiocordyceps unilateralis TaxID=268505 RepID=A0A2A9PCH4_OPHUN|nr:hypothetical protein XA68_13485 [Ophiocordyceps unilateralis]